MSSADPVPRPHRATREDVAIRRHQGRVIALQVLFEVDVTDHPLEEVLARALDAQDATTAMREHVSRLVHGVIEKRDEIDERIGEAATAFPVDQLPNVDRNVLRVATFELLFESAVPPKAAINEAVEIAKRFGGPNSSKFVNGALRTILRRIEEERSENSPEITPE